MFSEGIKIMLYVDNVAASAEFWQKIGFAEIEREEVDGTLVVEVAPTANAATHLVLYDRNFIEQHSPEVATNQPSLMFESAAIEDLYRHMKDSGVRVGELIQLPTGLVFNFTDPDDNYFAVSGI